MHYEDAMTLVHYARDLKIDYYIPFVSPIVSAVSAAINAHDAASGCGQRIKTSGSGQTYAENNGLSDALRGQYCFPLRSGLQGVTYTKLTRLANHSEVDRCNEVINDLIAEQLGGCGFDAALRKVVGELHDNVASHASGVGFSCVQVYTTSGVRRLEFAIADCGRGMLRNVRIRKPEITDDADAIRWCLQKGNTTAQNNDSWAQFLPDDAIGNPMGGSSVRRSEDHHVGEGLWRLSELIRNVNGNVWIATGNGQYLLQTGKERYKTSPTQWNGVAIEIELPISQTTSPTFQQQRNLNELAERMGL